MSKIIFTPTIQSTGTKFLINFLERITQTKVIGLPVFLNQRPDHGRIHLIHVHIWWDGSYLKETKQMCSESHVIIPIRDPLAAVVWASVRDQNLGVRCAKTFVTLMEIGEEFNVNYLPIDILSKQTFDKRLIALKSILPEDYRQSKKDICNDWAARWPVYNAHVYDLKQSYLNKDKEILSDLEGYKELIENQSILRPWLEKMGYKKLLWWE